MSKKFNWGKPHKEGEKGGPIGPIIDPQSWNRRQYWNDQRAVKDELGAALGSAQGSADKMRGYSQEQRDFWLKNGLPLQQGLADRAVADLNPDNAAIDARTTADAQASADVNRGMMNRQYERMGVTANEDAERKLGLSQALGQASAANSTRDAMIQRGTAEAQSLALMGQNEAATALGGLQAGSVGETNYYVDQAMGSANKILNNAKRDVAGGQALPYKDGGVVGGNEVKLESGDVVIPAHVVKILGKDYFDRLTASHGG